MVIPVLSAILQAHVNVTDVLFLSSLGLILLFSSSRSLCIEVLDIREMDVFIAAKWFYLLFILLTYVAVFFSMFISHCSGRGVLVSVRFGRTAVLPSSCISKSAEEDVISSFNFCWINVWLAF